MPNRDMFSTLVEAAGHTKQHEEKKATCRKKDGEKVNITNNGRRIRPTIMALKPAQ